MNTAKDTRRESYDSIQPKVADRRHLILEILGSRQMTAHELTEELLAKGYIKFYDSNFVSHRLTELKAAGIVKTVGKRLYTKTDKNVAVWARVKTRREVQDELGETLCEYCPREPERRGVYSTPGGNSAGCEGSNCAEAYERYIEETEAQS